MKRFILNIILFVSPILLAAIVMEFLLRHIPNDYLYKKTYLDNHSEEIETLILGNSHTFYGIDPVYFSTECFNVSNVSQTLTYDLEIIKKFQDRFIDLKTIVLPVSYFSLYDKLEVNKESWRIKNYVIYCGIDAHGSLKYHSEVLSNKLYVILRRLYTYYIKGVSAVSCTEKGCGKINDSARSHDLNVQGKNTALRHTAGDYKYLHENLKVLNELIELCKKRNVKVLIITPPAYKTYRVNLSSDQLNKTTATAKEIANKYENCRYVNLLDNPEFLSEDYFDVDHLNETGAGKLSVIIDGIIDEWQNTYDMP